ncbi:MAG: hypothetical protein P8174_02690 [Gemmatimonadota bacterium]
MMSVAAAGWLVLEVVSSLVDRGILPNLLFEVLLVWYIGGLAATVVLGWDHGETGHQNFTKPELLMLIVLGVGVLSGSAATVRHGLKHAPTLADDSANGLSLRHIAVMYFADETPDKQSQALADGLTEGLIQELSQVNGLSVVSANGSEAYRNSDLKLDSIARALKVGTLVQGSVERRGDQLRVNVSLVDGSSGAEVKREAFEEPAANIGKIRDELSTDVARNLREWLGQEVELQSQRAATTSNVAWLLVQRAQRARKESEQQVREHDVKGAFASLDAADSLLAEAQKADTSWVEPTLLLGQVAYQRSRWLDDDPPGLAKAVKAAEAYADQVLQKSPGDASALTLRGKARYWRYLSNVDEDPMVRQKVFEQARKDLNDAVQKDPSQAEAYSALSSLDYLVDDVPAALLAARSAYQQDAFLQAAPAILWRLFISSYDMEQFVQAKRWCDEGWRRFPNQFRFAECNLWLMTAPSVTPDVPAAWRWLARMDSVLAAPDYPYYSREGLMLVGGIIGRAGLADSARAVMVRARGNAQIDQTQDLVGIEAFARTLVGDQDTAMSLLQRYIAANPSHAFTRGGSMSWWWRNLRENPAFQSVFKSKSAVTESH